MRIYSRSEEFGRKDKKNVTSGLESWSVVGLVSHAASSVAVESLGRVFRFSALDAYTVVRGGGVLAWGVLGTHRGRVLKTVEGFLDIILARDVASSSIVVPIEVKAAVGLAFPIFVDRVIFLESIS